MSPNPGVVELSDPAICQNRHKLRCGNPRIETLLVAPRRTGDLCPAPWLRGDGGRQPDTAAGRFRLGKLLGRATANCGEQAGQGTPVGPDGRLSRRGTPRGGEAAPAEQVRDRKKPAVAGAVPVARLL